MRSAGASTRHAITVGLAASAIFFLAPRTNAQQPKPPPPAPADPIYPNDAERQFEDAEQSDSGRGLEFVYFDVGSGAQFVSLEALSSNNVYIAGAPLETSSFGPSFSAGTGLRLLFFTVGPRFRFGTFSDWDFWTLNLDLGWRIPLGKLDPYAFVGGGFAKLAYHSGAGDAGPDAGSTGFDVRFGGGLDYYVSNVLSVGGKLDVDLLRLSHSVTNASRMVLVHSWSSLGLVITPGAVAGLHF